MLLLTAQDLHSLDQDKRAQEIDEEALNLFRKEKGGETSKDTAAALNALVIDYLAADHTKAIECGKQAIQIYQKVLNENDPQIAFAYCNLGGAYEQIDDYQNALLCHQKAFEIGKKGWGAEHPSLAKVLEKIATCYENLGEYKKATEKWQDSVDINERSLGKEHPDTGLAICGMANYFSDIGDYSRAIPLFESALLIEEKATAKDSLQVAYVLDNMASCYGHKERDQSRAIKLRKRVIEIRQSKFGPDDPHTASAWAGLGCNFLNKDEPQAALPYLEKSYNIITSVRL